MHSLILPILIRCEQTVCLAVKSKGVLSVSIDIPSPCKIRAHKWWLFKFVTEEENDSPMWKPVFPWFTHCIGVTRTSTQLLPIIKCPGSRTHCLISFYLCDYDFDSISLPKIRAKSFAE